MLSASFKDMRLDSCMSHSLSFVSKSNLCLTPSTSSSKISDNHSGPHWGWKDDHAGIHICTICDRECCMVMDQSLSLSRTHKHTHMQSPLFPMTDRHTHVSNQLQLQALSVSQLLRDLVIVVVQIIEWLIQTLA